MLRFTLFGIPVTIRPSFLLVAALLGLSTGRVPALLIWIAVVFFSILIHELGHALTARGFGSEVEIELNAVGGLTSWSVPDGELGPGRRAMVAAAGSAVGVVFGAVVGAIWLTAGPFTGLLEFTVTRFILVNLVWGLLNWLPLRPLDGGHLLTSLLQKLAPERADRIGNVTFFITAALGLAAALWFRLLFVAIIAAWLLLAEFNRGRPRRPQVPIPPMTFDDSGDTEPEEAITGAETSADSDYQMEEDPDSDSS